MFPVLRTRHTYHTCLSPAQLVPRKPLQLNHRGFRTVFLRTSTTTSTSTSTDDQLDQCPSPSGSSPEKSLLEHLTARGLVESVTGLPGSLDTFLRSQKTTVYAGVDPTAPSLHVGHLLPLMNLLHFYLNGHTAIALVGKSTATVGDPSGRITERTYSGLDTTTYNTNSLTAQLQLFFTRATTYALSRGYSPSSLGITQFLSNESWLGNLSLVEFLSTVGRVVRVNQMLSRQSVKGRMESEKGISFAEFTYQLLQSYDFWWLWREKGCRVQIGGNDQYGNITAGIDLISRLSPPSSPDPPPPPPSSPSEHPSDSAYGLTTPLLTTPTGAKLGKSTTFSNSSIWLSSQLTSPFSLHQYFLRLPDPILPQLLRSLTLLPLDQIEEVLKEHDKCPEERLAQRVLADEIVEMVHGAEEKGVVGRVGEVIFGYPSTSPPTEGGSDTPIIPASTLLTYFAHDPRLRSLPRALILGEYTSKVAFLAGAVKSRSEGENLVKQGGLYICGYAGAVGRGRKVERGEKVQEGMLIEGRVLLLRVGKGGVCVVKVEED